MGLEEDWANGMADDYDIEKLADFLAGNPDPTSGILTSCDGDKLEKVLLSLFRAVQVSNDELAEEVVETTFRSVGYKYQDEAFREHFLSTLIKIIRDRFHL